MRKFTAAALPTIVVLSVIVLICAAPTFADALGGAQKESGSTALATVNKVYKPGESTSKNLKLKQGDSAILG